jgi:hypothetical protein
MSLFNYSGVLFSLVFLGIGFQLAAIHAPGVTIVETAPSSSVDIHPACANYTYVFAVAGDL